MGDSNSILEKDKAINLEDLVYIKDWIDKKTQDRVNGIETKIEEKTNEVENVTVPGLDKLSTDIQRLAFSRIPEIKDVCLINYENIIAFEKDRANLCLNSIRIIPFHHPNIFLSLSEIRIDPISYYAVDKYGNIYGLKPVYLYKCFEYTEQGVVLFDYEQNSESTYEMPIYFGGHVKEEELGDSSSISERNITGTYRLFVKDIYGNIITKDFVKKMHGYVSPDSEEYNQPYEGNEELL